MLQGRKRMLKFVGPAPEYAKPPILFWKCVFSGANYLFGGRVFRVVVTCVGSWSGV